MGNTEKTEKQEQIQQQPRYKRKDHAGKDSSDIISSQDHQISQRNYNSDQMTQFGARGGPARPTKIPQTLDVQFADDDEEEKLQGVGRGYMASNQAQYYREKQSYPLKTQHQMSYKPRTQDYSQQPYYDAPQNAQYQPKQMYDQPKQSQPLFEEEKRQKQYIDQRQCKYGLKCYNLINNQKCKFFHSEEEIRIVQRELNQNDKMKGYRSRPVIKDIYQPKATQGSKTEVDSSYKKEADLVIIKPQYVGDQMKKSKHAGFFSYSFLQELLKIEDDVQLKNKIDDLSGSLKDRLNATRMQLKIPFLFIKLLEKLIKQKSKPIVRGILTDFMESDFIKNLSKYYLNMFSDIRLPYEQKQEECLAGISVIISLMETFPSRIEALRECVMNLNTGADMIILKATSDEKSLIEQHKKNLMSRFMQYCEDLQVEEEEKKSQFNLRSKKGLIKPKNDEEYKKIPEQDFKKIEVFPNEEEICHRDRLIRRMPKEGDLLTKSNYLDILFRLLHDDSIHDLRVGVKFMRQMAEKQQQLTRGQFRKLLKEETSVKIYDGIYLQNLDFIEGSRCIQFRMEMDKNRFVDWRIAKKLLPGSLVILSHDNFQTLFIGLLKNYDGKQRNETHQKYGYISTNVEILRYPDDIPSGYELFQIHGRTNFQMIESSAYFESYRHVLSQLQQMDLWENLPMQQYLVHGRSDKIQPPDYINEMLYHEEDEVFEMISEMNFDLSQLEAIKQVLNNNLALIQGPPGTGKTYIGVQVVKLLITYAEFWQDKGPILLVCYTNHALHQFLDFVKEFTNKIIKIGGKNLPEYHEFNLKEKLKNHNMGRGFGKIYRELKESETRVKYAQADLSKYDFKIINSILEEEDAEETEFIQNLLKALSKQFQSFLTEELDLAFHGQENFEFLKEVIEENFSKLRQNTKDNIIVLIWLGIIDIRKFIQFMIHDEDRKDQIKYLYNQIQDCQLKQQYCQRNIDKLDKDLFQLQKSIEECTQFIASEEEQKRGRKGQNRKFKSVFDAKKKLDNYYSDLQYKQGYYNSQQMVQEEQNKLILDFQMQIEELKDQAYNFQNEPQEENQIDNNDFIDNDQRDMDYDDYRFEYSNDIISLQDVLCRIFIPDNVNDIFEGVNSIYDCIGIASQYLFDDEEYAINFIKEAISDKNLFDESKFSIIQRWSINNYLLDNLISKHLKLIDKYIEAYKTAWDKKYEKESDCAGEIIKGQHIVAMTTTGRAKYSQYFENVTFPIVIVEEAAEVFEAHIMTSLSKNTEHLILIGDHEQLRPSPAVHELDIQYNLSVSLFERLISNKISHATLNIQRRMRSEISKMMNFIYPELKNHDQVSDYPNVKGVSKNLYFFDHDWKEDTNDFMVSKFNVNEAKIVVRFAQYIIQQKQYKSQDITILTLYAGQLLKIKSLLKENPMYESHLKQIRVVNVDNYQGEENKIILLSLVRSNPAGQIGFLKTSNRVCVALSRAKHGLFIFGNSTCLTGGKKKLDLWIKIIKYLKENEFLGDYLPLKCQNHDDIAKIKTVEDFKLVPEGGCQQECNIRLECGHKCEAICHPYQKSEDDPTGHNSQKCNKDCQRELPCGHPCIRKCFECKNYNQPCKTMIEKIMEDCGHKVEIYCHEKDSNQLKCRAKCGKLLECGHNCTLSCFDKCSKKKCKEQVEIILECGHTQLKDCSQQISEVKCYNECNQLLPCGHRCQANCSTCQLKGEHDLCKHKCNRVQVCGHLCDFPCTKNCPPCEKQCKTKCPHSQCNRRCQEVCSLCMEPCENQCPHSKCTKKCSQPCDRKPCNLPCDKKQKCGHPCVGLCGELCPTDMCRICQPDSDIFNEIIFGNENDSNALFIQIDCGHQFEVTGMDQWMKQEEQKESTSVKYIECFKCKEPIMKCPRYMKQINQTLNDINAIKKEILSNEEEYKEKLKEVEKDISELDFQIRKYNVQSLYFKTSFDLCEKLQKKFDKIRNSREPHLLNEVLQYLRLNHKIFMLAKIDNFRMSALSDQEKTFISQTLRNVRANYLQFTPSTIEECSNFTNQLATKFDMDDELKVIIDAIGLPRGHWNKCPNGHYYVIADCGGAEETSKCPDCQAIVGGSSHVLAPGNSFAKELGGHSAWDPDGFNQRVARGEINLQDLE